MRRFGQARVILAGLLGVAVLLLVVEFALGASSYGSPRFADPCSGRPSFTGGGIDGAVQRVALDALDGAACRLHTTREDLVLSFAPATGAKPIKWDKATIRAAVTAGFHRAVHDAEARGGFDSIAAVIIDRLAGESLVDWLVKQATGA